MFKLVFVADNFQALIQYSDAISAQTGKAVCCHLISTIILLLFLYMSALEFIVFMPFVWQKLLSFVFRDLAYLV